MWDMIDGGASFTHVFLCNACNHCLASITGSRPHETIIYVRGLIISKMAASSDIPGTHILRQLFDKLSSKIELNGVVSVPVREGNPAANIHRNELIAKLLTTCLGLAVSFTITFFGVKWLANAIDPTKQEKKEAQQRAQKLMRRIVVEGAKLSEYELCIASNLVDPLSMVVSWEDIGGLEHCIEEIQETVILPFKRKELFADSDLLQPPKGVLLYGPPGCGKTMIAKATAKAAGARFINLQVSSLVDKWYGESQKRTEAVFSLAMKLQPTIIFIDEIDSFLRSRNSSDHEATAMIKTQFMSFWDGLMTDAQCRIMIMGATNRPQDVDAAILRRMPSMFHVSLPKTDQRQSILELILRNEPLGDDIDITMISDQTEGFSGSDLKELCRNAAIYRVRDYLKAEREDAENETFHTASSEPQSSVIGLRPISLIDFQRALQKMKQTKTVTNLSSMAHVDLD